MSSLIKKYPVAAFYIVALFLGAIFTAPFIANYLGLIPPVPFILIFGAAFSASLAGIIVTGVISGKAGIKKLLGRFLIWRFGIGWWLAESATQLDMPVLMCICLFMGIVFVITNLTLDILYAYIDPRIRLN